MASEVIATEGHTFLSIDLFFRDRIPSYSPDACLLKSCSNPIEKEDGYVRREVRQR